MRQKRTAQVKAHIPPDVLEQLELFRAEEGGRVLSMSDYLFTVIEQHIAIRSATRRPAMRASQQKYGRRAVESSG